MVTIEEYKAKLKKKVVVPSGLELTIRRMPLRVVVQLFEIMPTVTRGRTADDLARDPEYLRKLPELIELVLPECVEEIPEKLNVDELLPDDAMALLGEIFDFSGLSEEAAQRRERFRRK